MRILFVCLGNICRSPTAEGVMRRLVADAGLEAEIEVASAGTGGWHVGHAPDERATSAAATRGIELAGEARRVTPADFEDFDMLIAMDRSNRDALVAMAPDSEARKRVFLLREFGEGDGLDVPDPYYGGADGFEDVLDIVERSSEALLEELKRSPT
jgi:protein-tyrosine phosphatase